MKDEKKSSPVSTEPAELESAGIAGELDESELQDVAGGVTWHWTPEETTPAQNWEEDGTL